MISILANGVPAVRAYSKLLLELDDLMAAGKGNGPEADEIRERMEQPWNALTEQERERVGGLSEDLYALADGGPKSVPMSEAERARWAQEARRVLADANQPEAALAFLRRPFPQGVPAYVIPFLQSRLWESLDDLEVSLRFMREAERHDPSQAIDVLILLEKLGRATEAEPYAKRILLAS
jgi:hypothetical protein